MKQMSLAEKNAFGTLVVKFMTGKINAAEDQQLHEWLCDSEDHLFLFENLIDDINQKWAQKWFYEADVSTKGVKWKKIYGWYRPETKSLADFYIVMAVVCAFLILIYIVLEYL